jgi:hypothetical protein
MSEIQIFAEYARRGDVLILKDDRHFDRRFSGDWIVKCGDNNLTILDTEKGERLLFSGEQMIRVDRDELTCEQKLAIAIEVLEHTFTMEAIDALRKITVADAEL